MLRVKLTCGDVVECDDGQREVTKIDACECCTALIRERMTEANLSADEALDGEVKEQWTN